MSDSVPTLFDKYGGVPAVRSLVREFHQRFAASPTLRRYFENVSAEKFIQHHAELIAYTLGRPTASFDPRKMSEQHHPHDISASSFEQVINILRQVLLDANFEGRDIAQIIYRLDQQRHRIVRDVQPLNDIYHPEHVDALTGLGNQDGLMAALSEECVKYQKEQRPLSLAILRPVRYGREELPTDHAGIQLLDRHLTGVLSRTARRADTLCRRSDGLFALVLRATDAGKAMQAARRIHLAVTRELFATATGKQRIDLAIGLASCSDTASSAESLLLAAERAFGRAGQAGKMIVEA
ncbi:MAG: diguanylate cyclase [Oxalobacteraceae bacterium]|nr:diguanylate cyclase [Oxalobacteraceae bacterium]